MTALFNSNKDAVPYEGDTPLRINQHEQFAVEYLIDLDPAKAAVRAGYSRKTAFQRGYRLLNRPDINSRIKFFRSYLAEKCMVTPERIIREYMKCAFTDISDIAEYDGTELKVKKLEDIPSEHRGAVSEITEIETKTGGKRVRVKLYDKLKALKDLGQHLGMFQDAGLHIHSDPETSYTVEFVPSKSEAEKTEKRVEEKVKLLTSDLEE